MYQNNQMKKVFIGFFSMLLLFSLLLTGCSDTGSSAGEPAVSDPQPTVADMYETLQENEALPFVITEKAKAMLAANPDLFTANSMEGLEAHTEYTLDYRTVMKNITEHGDKLMYIPEAYVLSIQETDIDGQTLTVMQVVGADEKDYCIYGLTSYEGIYEDDVVECYALPLGDTSFENVGGGTTLAVVMAGCYVNKLEY